jgi:hypothetical protein
MLRFQICRRKAGFVALLISIALTICWMRSYVLDESLSFDFAQANHHFTSTRGTIQYVASYPLIMFKAGTGSLLADSTSRLIIETQWMLGEFCFGVRRFPDDSTRWMHVKLPYWAIIAPVTLLSAYFLLVDSHPKRRKLAR